MSLKTQYPVGLTQEEREALEAFVSCGELPRALNFLILIWQTIKIGELFLPPVDWMLNKMTIEETL